MAERGGLNPIWQDKSIDPDKAVGIMPVINVADKICGDKQRLTEENIDLKTQVSEFKTKAEECEEREKQANEKATIHQSEIKQHEIARKKAEKKAAKAEERASTDKLTKLPNKHFLEKEFPKIWSKEEDACIALMDINGFKVINDLQNKTIADNYLKSIANGLKSAIRATDMVARLQGDEFAIFFKDCSEDKKQIFKDLIKQVGYKNGLNLSIGITTLKYCKDNNYKTLEEVLDKAEEEMKLDQSLSSREMLAIAYYPYNSNKKQK